MFKSLLHVIGFCATMCIIPIIACILIAWKYLGSLILDYGGYFLICVVMPIGLYAWISDWIKEISKKDLHS